MNTHAQNDCKVDQEDIELDLLLSPRPLNPLDFGSYPAPAKPTGMRLRAFAIPSSSISTLDHLYGPGAALQLLSEHFELKPGYRFDESHREGMMAFLVAEDDYKRLGGQRFEHEVPLALQALVADVPVVDAQRATDQVAIQSLIEAGVLDRRSVDLLGEVRRQAVLEGDLGL